MSTDLETLLTLAAAGNLPATTDYLMSLPHDVRADAIKIVRNGIPKPQAIKLRYNWSLHARDSQLPPEGDWDTWLILAGRGFGKTRTGAEWVRAQVQDRHAHRIALVARTLPEAQSIMIEGESGLLNICPPSNKPTYEPSKRKLTWPNGAFALAFSSHEPDQLRGPQFDAAWCDELASWEYPAQTWDNLNFALRLGRHPRSVVTTTPKPIELVRSLPNKPGVYVTRGSTYENQDNLAPSFFKGITDQYDGTRIGQQEIHAELMDEDEDALWKREWIENARLRTQPPLSRIVVAVDPAMSTGPTSSETGIVVVGADMRRQHAYVLADESGRLSPNNWALRVIHLYDKFNATMIVVEDNAGGQMAEATIQNAVERTLPVKTVKAPVAASTSGPNPSPPSTNRAASTTSVASPPSKTRCVPGTPTSARPNHPTAPTPSSTPSPSSSSTATPSTSGKPLSLTPYTLNLIPYYPNPKTGASTWTSNSTASGR